MDKGRLGIIPKVSGTRGIVNCEVRMELNKSRVE